MGGLCPSNSDLASDSKQQTTPIVPCSQYDIVDQEGKNTTQKNMNISLKDFTIVKLLGQGSFGKVFLVRQSNANEVYAMKTLNKKFLKSRNQISHTKSERQILATNECLFIVKLFYAFQDHDKLYLVLEFMQGGELFFHLKKVKKFTEDSARFYAAEIILALSYLHKQGIIYRDLKPENILMDAKGHVKLTDFGMSKSGVANSGDKTYTFCGTPEYLAPEILQGVGHNEGVDWWSLGVLIYEMVNGCPPFYSKERMELYKSIIEIQPEMKPWFSQDLTDLLGQLIERNPENRLGKNGAEEIMRHPFFKCINWDKLKKKEVEPPFIPKIVGGLTDVANFDKGPTDQSAANNNGPSLIEMSQSIATHTVVGHTLAGQTYAGFTYSHIKPAA